MSDLLILTLVLFLWAMTQGLLAADLGTLHNMQGVMYYEINQDMAYDCKFQPHRNVQELAGYARVMDAECLHINYIKLYDGYWYCTVDFCTPEAE